MSSPAAARGLVHRSDRAALRAPALVPVAGLLILAAVCGPLARPSPAAGESRFTPPPVAVGARHDSAWADAVAQHVEALRAAGYSFRAAEWALFLAGDGRSAPRGAELLSALPPHDLTATEFLYLGSEATRRGPGTRPVLLALAARASADRNATASTLVAAARALGADSAAAVQVGLGLPRPRALRQFTIGALAPVDGRLARQGEAFVQAAALAVEEHNRSARFPVTLMVGDTRGEPLAAARAAAELASAGVGVLVGDILPATTVPVAAAAAAAAIPLITPAPGREDLASIGPHVFRTSAPRAYQAEALARAARDLGFQRLALLAPDTEGGRDLGDRFAQAAAVHGVAVVGREIYRAGEVDFGPALERLKVTAPDGIFLPGTPRELMTAIPQLAYYEVGARLLALEELAGKDVSTVALEYLDEAYFAESYYEPPLLGGESFAARYRRRFGGEPDATAARGYIATALAARALATPLAGAEGLVAALAASAVPRTALLAPPEGGSAVPVFRLTRSGITPVRSGGL